MTSSERAAPEAFVQDRDTNGQPGGDEAPNAQREPLSSGIVASAERSTSQGAACSTVPGEPVGGRGVPEWHEVAVVFYEQHRKEARPPCLRVTYNCGVGRRFNEFLCFEHGGWATGIALAWWSRFGGLEPGPATTFEARVRAADCGELLRTLRVLVDPRYDRDYPEVVGYHLADGRRFARRSATRKEVRPWSR